MSEDTTKDIKEKYSTQPTIQTILERFDSFEQSLNARIDKRFDEVNLRLDKIDGMVHITRGEMLALRADFNELKGEFQEFRSQFKQPA